MTGQRKNSPPAPSALDIEKPCTGNKKAMMAIVLNNDHSSCGVLCHYLKIIFLFHCPSESLWLLGIQWSIPNVAMIIMNGTHYPRLENFWFSNFQPSIPHQKSRIVVVLVSWVCSSPWQHVLPQNSAKPCPHTHASARVKLVDFQSKEELLEAVTHPDFAMFPAW